MPRTIKNPGVFAADAQTTIPPTPVVGIAYRNAATGLAAIRAGWPFKTIVDSSDFAQILHELTSLTDLIDKTGILEYKGDIDYDLVPAFAVGSDGELYKSTAINGPATTVIDPVGDLTGVWADPFAVAGPVAVSGTATFTNSTNNIALVGFGAIAGIEVGDVYTITGTVSNNGDYTVDVITDDDNVIVNQAHAGATTSKSLVDETSSATVVLLARAAFAPIGLGQGYADVKSDIISGVTYTNTLGRAMSVIVTFIGSDVSSAAIEVAGDIIANVKSAAGGDAAERNAATFTVPKSQTYEVDAGGLTIDKLYELR